MCNVYDSKYYKVLTIACCDTQFEDDATQIFLWENLSSVITKNGISTVNFKDFMAYNAHAN